MLVKDFQIDHIIERLDHIDFFEIERGRVLRARVLLHYVGNPVGVREGGLQELLVHEVEVESLPATCPRRSTSISKTSAWGNRSTSATW